MNLCLENNRIITPSNSAIGRLKRKLILCDLNKDDYKNIVELIYNYRDETNEYILGVLYEESFETLSISDIENILIWLEQLVDM